MEAVSRNPALADEDEPRRPPGGPHVRKLPLEDPDPALGIVTLAQAARMIGRRDNHRLIKKYANLPNNSLPLICLPSADPEREGQYEFVSVETLRKWVHSFERQMNPPKATRKRS